MKLERLVEYVNEDTAIAVDDENSDVTIVKKLNYDIRNNVLQISVETRS